MARIVQLLALAVPASCLVVQPSLAPHLTRNARAAQPAMGFMDRFKKDGGAAVAEKPAEKAPEPPAEPEMEMKAMDKVLVKLGMKTEEECELEPKNENLMEQIKCAGRAGIISYILWEWAFWIGAGGFAAITYYQTTGGWPDLSNAEDQAKVGASAFALVNVARFAVPLRIGLALSTVPWVDDNLVKPFIKDDEDKQA